MVFDVELAKPAVDDVLKRLALSGVPRPSMVQTTKPRFAMAITRRWVRPLAANGSVKPTWWTEIRGPPYWASMSA